MSEFRLVRGFEEVWRPPAAPRRRPEAVLGGLGASHEVRARLARIVRRAPEVMVKVTGRTRGPAHLKAHLEYISRKGELELEGPDGCAVSGLAQVRELAEDWEALAATDSRRRANSPLSLSLVLSMPKGSDPIRVRDAARGFAEASFGGRFDYVFALHTDEPHPHVHLAVRSLGYSGERLNPKKADLQEWREVFARELRDRGLDAEATPRRARGVIRKAERGPIRRLRERAEAGRGEVGRVHRGAVHAAARLAFGVGDEVRPWEGRLAAWQGRVRALYLAQARLLQASAQEQDRALGRAVEAFVREMPVPETQRQALARVLRVEGDRQMRDITKEGQGNPGPFRDR